MRFATGTDNTCLYLKITNDDIMMIPRRMLLDIEADAPGKLENKSSPNTEKTNKLGQNAFLLFMC